MLYRCWHSITFWYTQLLLIGLRKVCLSFPCNMVQFGSLQVVQKMENYVYNLFLFIYLDIQEPFIHFNYNNIHQFNLILKYIIEKNVFLHFMYLFSFNCSFYPVISFPILNQISNFYYLYAIVLKTFYYFLKGSIIKHITYYY